MSHTIQPPVNIMVESEYSTKPNREFAHFSFTRTAGGAERFKKLTDIKRPESTNKTVTVLRFTNPSELVRARKLVKRYSGRPVIAVASPAVYNLPKFRDVFKGDLVEVFVEDPQNFHVENLNEWITKLIKKPAGGKHLPQIKVSTHPLDLSARLRDPKTGRLDARKLGKLMGISSSDLATKVCGISKQALSQSPFSAGIQEKLQPLEEIAHFLSWCDHDESKLRAWLNRPNRDFPPLEGKIPAPMHLILHGHADIVGNEVRNLRLGHPS